MWSLLWVSRCRTQFEGQICMFKSWTVTYSLQIFQPIACRWRWLGNRHRRMRQFLQPAFALRCLIVTALCFSGCLTYHLFTGLPRCLPYTFLSVFWHSSAQTWRGTTNVESWAESQLYSFSWAVSWSEPAFLKIFESWVSSIHKFGEAELIRYQ